MADVVIERLSGPEGLEEILAIDRVCFSSPWTRAMYDQELANDHSYIFTARIPGEPIAGYCSCWLVVDELHINNIAVRPEARGRGLGQLLVRHVLKAGYALGARSATLEVRGANETARRLYARLGFRDRGLRRAYYQNPPDDAVIMWVDLQEVGSTPNA